jgi:hypothetical protein
MVATLQKNRYGFEVGLFRRSSKINYLGSLQQLFDEVASYNETNEGKSRVVISSAIEIEDLTLTVRSSCKSISESVPVAVWEKMAANLNPNGLVC